jgi:Flp pilus assembly protein TadG
MPPPTPLSAVRRFVRRFSRNRRGSAAVEFALVAPMFFALIFAILETALVFFASQTLEVGTQDTARLLLTNQAEGTMSQQQFLANLCANVTPLLSCANLYVDVKTYNSFTAITAADLALPIDGSGNLINNFGYPTPNPGDTVLVRAYYTWPIFVTKLFGYNLSNMTGNYMLLNATAAFRVEPGS